LWRLGGGPGKGQGVVGEMVDRLAGKRPFVVGGNAGSAAEAQAAMEERRQPTC